MRASLFPILFLFVFCLAAVGQTPTPKNDTDDVVKITTKLVQIDVVVTDRKGEQVRELGVSDFEVLQDGKVQKITGLTYVPIDSAQVTNTLTAERPKNPVPPPPARPGSAAAGRVIALLVDDGSCAASLWGINSAKDGIKRFINEQMLPDDRVAIYRTRAGSSAFQQYTSDKAVLLKVADKIRWYPPQGCGNADGSFTEAAKSNTFTRIGADGTMQQVQIESDAERKSREYREDSIANNQVVGTLGVLRYALNGLERAPGRKLMFFFSDSLAFRNRQNETLGARDALRGVTDAANRAGVVVHTLSLRGADVTGMIESKDEVYVRDDFNASEAITKGRRSDAQKAVEGLAVLAYDTGGDFYQGSDRLNVPIGKVLRRESGYYLIAYEPAEDSFKGKKFNKIEVKVKVPDLNVAYRAGFTGVVDAEASRPRRKSADSELYEAIASPLPKPGLNIDLTAFFGNSAAGGNFVRSLFHLAGSQLVFTDEPNGQKKAVIDVVAVTMDEKNEVIDEFTRTHTLKFDPATAARITQNGLIYSTDVPIKKAGSYNFRVAVRDANSKLIGSSSQVVEIPDLKRSDVYLSGLTIAGVDQTGKFPQLGPTTAETAIDLPSSYAVPAIRRFKRGSVVAYSYSIYNARPDKATGKPNLTLQVNLFKDGKAVVEGAPTAISLENQTDATRLSDFSYLRLSQTEPGEYALQLIVRDLAAGKNAVSSQWIDFEVVD